MSVDPRRIVRLNAADSQPDGRYVLYWMEHSQRSENNPALEWAVTWANALQRPLVVLFVVDPDYPEGNARHFTFMLQGLRDTKRAIEDRGALFTLRKGSPPAVAVDLAQDAAVVVTDRGYLRHLLAWRAELAQAVSCRIDMVEGDVIVPVELASPKQETAARTIRPKLHRQLAEFAVLPAAVPLERSAHRVSVDPGENLDDVAAFVGGLECDESVPPVDTLIGGPSEARRRMGQFMHKGIRSYAEGRADIVTRNVSMLSPYLHLGQLSPVELYLAAKQATNGDTNYDSYVDEFFVRRELAANYVFYQPDHYDSYSGLPEWARVSLELHQNDVRETVYSEDDLENGRTGDPYWNAAMREMRETGYLHNHLRMYWGKRLIAFTARAEDAFRIALKLNNKYLLDGRDHNSYANVSWLFGLHDRGWPEREVYGKVRIMKPSGLERKFDMRAYLKWVRTIGA